MKKNILVFPCGSEIGLEIYRSLQYSLHFTLFGASTVDDHGKYTYENYIPNIPFVDDEKFISEINRVINEYDIDFIVPAHDSVVLRLAKAKAEGQLSAEVITSSYQTCEIARSKSLTYKTLSHIIKTPKIFTSIASVKSDDFPVFLKPDVGQGSRGVCVAKNKDELNYFLSNNPNLIILEMLPGDEYTVDCFTDRHGILKFCEGRIRERVSGGISVNSSVVSDVKFQEIADKINNTIDFRGAWFFQVKLDNKEELSLLEIAPRIAGTSGLVRCRGVNLIMMSLFDAMDVDIDVVPQNSVITIDRALENKYKNIATYDHVYIDFDDLVICDEKINIRVISFLYQCINRGIKLHLITKHKGILPETLDKYRLTALFDELIWLKPNDCKSDFIKEENAIFIDDSFVERKDVYEKNRIPVFDAHMVESLIN